MTSNIMKIHGKSAKISGLLKSFGEIKNVRGCVIANQDGLPISSYIVPHDKEMEYLLCAVSSTLLFTGENISHRLKLGSPQQVKLDLQNGLIIVTQIQEMVCFGIILDKSANLPYFEIKIQEYIKKIDQILFYDGV